MRLPVVRTAAALVGLTGVLLASTASAAVEESESRFFMRQDGCGTTEEPGRLSTVAGTDTNDGCGIIGGPPLDEVFFQLDGETLTPYQYTTEDGVPLTVDATRDVTGVFSTQAWNGVAGAGEVVVDLVLTATRLNDKGKTVSVVVGEGSFSTLVVPGTSSRYRVPFTLDVPDALQGVELRSLTLDAQVHGANVGAQASSLEGNSYLDVPTLVTTEDPAEE